MTDYHSWLISYHLEDRNRHMAALTSPCVIQDGLYHIAVIPPTCPMQPTILDRLSHPFVLACPDQRLPHMLNNQDRVLCHVTDVNPHQVALFIMQCGLVLRLPSEDWINLSIVEIYQIDDICTPAGGNHAANS